MFSQCVWKKVANSLAEPYEFIAIVFNIKTRLNLDKVLKIVCVRFYYGVDIIIRHFDKAHSSNEYLKREIQSSQ